MAIYCHAKPLLAALKVQKVSPIVGTSEDEPVLESRGGDKRLADCIYDDQLAIANTLEGPFVRLSWGEETSKVFVLS
jgi:hypothetical protein